MEEMKKKPEKEIKVEEKKDDIEKNEQESLMTFRYVTCDECKVCPIVGYRYKCLECPDYDLCHECFIKDNHKHNMMVIKNRRGKRRIHGVFNAYNNNISCRRDPLEFIVDCT